jgi:tetratricopeptide (TPR) repeat protein
LSRVGAFRVVLWAVCVGVLCGALTGAEPRATPAQTPAGTPGGTCLVVPFSNRSGDPSLDWLGESFVVSLRQALDSANLEVMTQAERDRARQLVGAPVGMVLSHATLIRMADAAGVRWLVTGWYDYDGDSLTAHADVVDLKREHLSRPPQEMGKLTDLETIQAQLDAAVRRLVAPGAAAAAPPPGLPLPAYEAFVRARLAPEGEAKIQLLETAMHLSRGDARVMLALGRAEWMAQHNADALYWLQKVPPTAPEAYQARFTAGLAAYRMGHFAFAERCLQQLSTRLPLPAVMHDLALAQARVQGRAAAGKLETSFPAFGYRQLAQAVAQATRAKWRALPLDRRVAAELAQGAKLAQQRAWAGAMQAYQAVLAAAPAGSRALATAHAGMAQVWWARHDRTQAAREARAALALDPANAAALTVRRELEASHE